MDSPSPAGVKPVPLMMELKTLFDSGKDSDVYFRVGDEDIHAHKFILSLRSPAMKELFTTHPADGYQCISSVSPGELKSFLNYIYTDECEITEANIEALMRLGDSYNVGNMVEKCVNFIEAQVNDTNAMRFVEISSKYPEAQRVLPKCYSMLPNCLAQLKFIFDQGNGTMGCLAPDLVLKVIKDCERPPEYEDELFKKVFGWAIKQCCLRKVEPTIENLKETLKDIIPHIKFERLEPRTLASFVRDNQLLHGKVILNILCQIIFKTGGLTHNFAKDDGKSEPQDVTCEPKP